MNINKEKKISPLKKNSFYLFFIIYVIFIFGINFYYRPSLYKYSIDVIEKLNDIDSLSYIGFFFSFLGDINTTYVLISLFFVFVNIYKSFVFFMVIYSCNFMHGFLSLLYKEHRPFWDLKPTNSNRFFKCEMNWGNPSATAMTSVAAFLTLYKITFSGESIKKRKVLRRGCLLLLLILLGIVNVSGIFQGVESFDQVIFGLTIGFAIYLLFFYVICVNLNNPDEFYTFLQISNIKIIGVNLGMFIVSIILFATNPTYEKAPENLNEVFAFYKSCDWDLSHGFKTRYLDEFCFLVIGGTIGNLGLILGIKSELFFHFKNDKVHWLDFNFVKPHSENESLLSEMTMSKDAQWNHTNGFVSFLRLLFTIMVLVIFFLPTILIRKHSFYLSLFVKTLFPNFFFTFFLTYPFKILLMKMNLTNQTNNFQFKQEIIDSQNVLSDDI